MTGAEATETIKAAGDLNIGEILRFTEEMVAEAAREAIALCDAGFTTELKRDGSVVTNIDRAIERLLRDRIGARYPDHAILGEEYGADGSADAPLWALDPIDGWISPAYGVKVPAPVLIASGRCHAGTQLVTAIVPACPIASAPPVLEWTYEASGRAVGVRLGDDDRLIQFDTTSVSITSVAQPRSA